METVTRKALAQVGISLPLSEEIDLYRYIVATTGVRIPRTRVCADHSTPWDAFVYSYYARGTNSIWKASRGFGGKTFLLGLLCDTEAKTLGASSSIMGGSERQSANLISYLRTWSKDPACAVPVAGERETRISFRNGAIVTALPASSKAARGPHVPRFRADEIDEMELQILEDGLGQTMSRPGIPQQNTFSSTYHNHAGTMAHYLKRARDRSWPVFEWCYRETSEAAGGWLPVADIAAKRETVSAYMWDVEYEMGAPNPGGRAINSEAVERAFRPEFGTWEGRDDETILLPGEPVYRGSYGHGADWAKKNDWTVVTTFRHYGGGRPFRCVAFRRIGRHPWPIMAGVLDDRMDQFGGGSACHDGTGLGDVVADILRREAEPVILAGRGRSDLLSDYIGAIERGEVEYPLIRWAYEEHLEASVADVYGSGSRDHCPDSIVAGALAYRAVKEASRGLRPGSITVPKAPSRAEGGNEWE